MNTQIKLAYKGVAYVLEYNRMAIKMLESAGFRQDEFLEKPMNNIELAFTALFIKNHPKTKQVLIDEIFDKCRDKNALIANITIMIQECYDSLLADPNEEDSEGNATWEVVDLSPKKKSQE